MYFREGAAYGFLFEARNSLLLGTNFSSDRRSRAGRGGVTEQKLKLAGREVSLISSPDGSVRSYYVTSGDYHFVTSSRALAERFLQVAKGPGSLGATKEFRHARTIMPLRATTRCSSIFPTRFSATSPGRTIAWKRCGDWNRWPTWNWCSLPSWPPPPRAARRHDRAIGRRRAAAGRFRSAARRQPGGARTRRGLRPASRAAGDVAARARCAGRSRHCRRGGFLSQVRRLLSLEVGTARSGNGRPETRVVVGETRAGGDRRAD